MELSYWISRWNRGKTGFHMKNGYPGLERNWQRLNLTTVPVVLVPLAGKSPDIMWLSEKSKKVIAVEISEIAIEQFFADNKLNKTIERYAGFDVYSAGNISFWCGDLMKLPRKTLPSIDLIYDKGSIVALPPDRRTNYIKKLISLCSPDTNILMHLISYPGQSMPGPPFSVTTEDIERGFGHLFMIQQLEQAELNLNNYEKFRQRGLKRNFFEFLLLLSRKQSI